MVMMGLVRESRSSIGRVIVKGLIRAIDWYMT